MTAPPLDSTAKDQETAESLIAEWNRMWGDEIRRWLDGRCQSAVAPNPWVFVRPELVSALSAARAEEREAQWKPFPEEPPPLPPWPGQVEDYLVTTAQGWVRSATWTHAGAWTTGSFTRPEVIAWMPFPAAFLRARGGAQ
jgi:hypothetical protein